MNCLSRIALFVFLGISPVSVFSDEKDLEKLEEKQAVFDDSKKKAKAALLEAFDQVILKAQKQTGASGEQRIKAVEALEVEKSAFENSGRIPFSPSMRDHAVRYLTAVNKLAGPLSASYQKLINRALNEGDSDLAKDLISQQNSLVFVVGIWDCYGVNFRRGEKFTWRLYSDFTVNRSFDSNDALPKGWSFQPNGGLLIKNFAPGAPKGGFSDKCQVSWDGVLFEAKNQQGGVYTGHLQ